MCYENNTLEIIQYEQTKLTCTHGILFNTQDKKESVNSYFYIQERE